MLYNSIVCYRLAAIVHRALLYFLETSPAKPMIIGLVYATNRHLFAYIEYATFGASSYM